MDGATDGIILKTFHLEAFIDDALASDSGITVDDDRDDSRPILLLATEEMLFGADSSLDAGVDSLQMRWVRHQGQLDLVT